MAEALADGWRGWDAGGGRGAEGDPVTGRGWSGEEQTLPPGSESPRSPDRTLLRPLARSVLRLNRLDGGRLKSESDPCEMEEEEEEAAGGGASNPFGSAGSRQPGWGDAAAGRGAVSRTSTPPPGAGGSSQGDADRLLRRLSKSPCGEFWRGGVGLAVRGGGAAEGGGQGTTTAAERLPAIGALFLLPSGWRRKKPSSVCVFGAARACVTAVFSRGGGSGLDPELGTQGGLRSSGRAVM